MRRGRSTEVAVQGLQWLIEKYRPPRLKKIARKGDRERERERKKDEEKGQDSDRNNGTLGGGRRARE